MVLADRDLKVLAANASLRPAFLGHEVEDIVGKTVASYSRARRHAERSRAPGTRSCSPARSPHYAMDKRYVRADGSLVLGRA